MAGAWRDHPGTGIGFERARPWGEPLADFAQLALQLVHFVAQARRVLEAQLARCFAHLFLERLDQAGQLVFRQSREIARDLPLPLLRVRGARLRCDARGLQDVADLLADRRRLYPVDLVELDLLLPAAVRLVDRALHRVG